MSFDPKALKKIADACRKAGITQFKNAEFEFTLSPDGPVSSYKRRKAKTNPEAQGAVIDESFQSDMLTEEQLLMWSSLDPSELETKDNQ